MPCNGFHISEVINACVKEMEPVDEDRLVAEVDQSLDPLFRMPPSAGRRGLKRIVYIRSRIRAMAKNNVIAKQGALYISSNRYCKSIIHGLPGQIRQLIKTNGGCTRDEIKKQLGSGAAVRIWRLVKTNQLQKDGDRYQLTSHGLSLTVTPIDKSRRLCGFKPSLV